MSDSLHTTLPIEYQLNYGTACGDLNGLNPMSQTVSDGFVGVHSILPQENFFGPVRINSSPLVIDSLDALMVSLNSR
jgi:hypothetical protein